MAWRTRRRGFKVDEEGEEFKIKKRIEREWPVVHLSFFRTPHKFKFLNVIAPLLEYNC
jgi:hypothetical protein